MSDRSKLMRRTRVRDEDLEETLALIRAKLVELEKAFKQGSRRLAFKLPD